MMRFLSRVFSGLPRPAYLRQGLGKFLAAPRNLDRQTLVQQHQFIQTLLAQPRYAEPKRLHRFEHQVFSQNGEDGALAEIFRRIGTTDRTFLEIGVGDGLENNTAFLLTQGWKGWWVDGGDVEIKKIKKHFWRPLAKGDLALRQACIAAENVAGILSELKVPTELDLFSLDIDRNTYFVWEALKDFRPRVLVVEYNASFPPPAEWTVEYRPDMTYNCTSYMGASLKSYERLEASLGYALVGCEMSGINAFFVRRGLCGDKFAEPFTAENHFDPPRYFLLRRGGHPRCFDDTTAPN